MHEGIARDQRLDAGIAKAIRRTHPAPRGHRPVSYTHLRKGWAPAFRDATMLKVAYGWGLRRREVRMLETNDFSANPSAPEFGAFGVCQVRWGKASKGGPPRRRSVLTVFGWATEVLAEWIEDVWPAMAPEGSGLWPSERGPLVSEDRINAAFTLSLIHI